MKIFFSFKQGRDLNLLHFLLDQIKNKILSLPVHYAVVNLETYGIDHLFRVYDCSVGVLGYSENVGAVGEVAVFFIFCLFH